MTEHSAIPPLKLGTYRHNKSQQLYEVVGVALDAETNEFLVVYKPSYTHELGYTLFTRAYDSFSQTVQINGIPQRRFEYIET